MISKSPRMIGTRDVRMGPETGPLASSGMRTYLSIQSHIRMRGRGRIVARIKPRSQFGALR
jgi:hypothetical protein